MSKTVGILGGMGPYATVAFFRTLLDLTPAKKDRDHLRVIVDDNPKIPSRTRHLLYGEPSPFGGMLESCLRLQAYPVELIAIPCNSACVLTSQLQAEIEIPVLNIIEISANALAKGWPEARRVAVLGGYVTYATKSYAPFLASHGIELVDHGRETQAKVESLIEALKLGRADAAEIHAATEIVRQLRTILGVDAVILACTEFGCLPQLDVDMPLIDSSTELARHVVFVARS